MTRTPSSRLVLLAVLSAVALAISTGCSLRAPDAPQGLTQIFSVGDCVEIPSKGLETAPQLRADKVPCSVDPSYTVGAMADESGACPSAEYQHLPSQSAEGSTARLCLVPNLVADHCYVLDMPIGMLQLADCAQRGQDGLLVQVTQRLDVRDQRACPADAGHYAWPYPSPPRTYCTLTLF
ncbi:MAG: hypothetical protein ABW137_24170 [Mycobacterium sp.]